MNKKFYAVEYQVRKNIVCTFDSVSGREKWIHDGNQDGSLRVISDEIECAGMPTHHATLVENKNLNYAVSHWEYNPPIDD